MSLTSYVNCELKGSKLHTNYSNGDEFSLHDTRHVNSYVYTYRWQLIRQEMMLSLRVGDKLMDTAV